MNQGISLPSITFFRPYQCLAWICLAVLIACSPFQPTDGPDQAMVLPETYALYNGAFDGSWTWWESVGSPELNRLIDEAWTRAKSH